MKVLRKILTVTAIVMLVAGIGLLLFPTVSNFIGTQIANGEADALDERVQNIVDDGDMTYEQALEEGKIDSEGYEIDEDGNRTSDTPVTFKADLDKLKKDSVAYNNTLKTDQYDMLRTDTYGNAALDLSSYGITDGVYCYVTAETIGMRLPVYLGANNLNMSYGAAHMAATSLPIGGEDTNTVLAGHTGYIGRIFFDNLRGLQVGDTVSITNYWETLDYKVTKTDVCSPNDGKYLYIEEGKDLLTMFTCISDGNGGYDRYYVICERDE